MAEERSWRVVGPLSGRLIVSDEDGRPRFRWPSQPEHDRRTAANKANARLILHRTAVALLRTDPDTGTEQLRDLDDEPIRIWAVDTDLGQRRDDELRASLAARRARALDLLASARNAEVLVIEIEPQGALITGTGAGGIRNVGIELHGTHGWPVIPASSLKGATAAHARVSAAPPDVARIFGAPRPASEPDTAEEASGGAGQRDKTQARPGSVLFFDALPGVGGVTVAEHVLTPHARDYHTGSDEAGGGRPAPAEYVNPVPIPFLAVDGGTFTAHLVGPQADVRTAAGLLSAAVDDIGVGAKTSAGYGYLNATERPPGPATPELAR